jgi:glycosyltransferase involved in cell wall biosynthesis
VNAVTAAARAAAPVPAAGRTRVLHVISTLLPGGTEYAALRLIRGLDPARYEFHVAWLRDQPVLRGEFEAAGARVAGMGLNGRIDPGCLARLVRHVRRHHIDLVHTHMDLADWYGAAAARLGGARALVSTKQNADEFRTRRTWKRWPFLLVERLAYEAADAVIVVSDGLVEFLRRAEHLPPRKMVVIGNGVDPGLAAAAPGRTEARRRLGLPPFDPVLGTLGRLAPQKGSLDLLRALPAVLRARPGAGLVFAGDGPLRAPLEREARALGIADRVAFLGFRRDPATVLAALDLFLFPSLWEGLPQALLEAMAIGVPVVAARAVGVAGLVRDGDTGLLVAPGEPESLASAALRLLADPGLASRLAARARETVLAEHTLAAVAERTDRLYRRLLGEEA